MLADDVACNPRNAEPGRLFNDRHTRLDLYGEDVEVDFRGEEVTVDNFLRLLTGRQLPWTPLSKRLLSDPDSHILLFLTGHGGDQFLKFQDWEEITSQDISDAFHQMYQQNRYRRILFLVDSCQSSTLQNQFISPNIIAAGCSKKGQNSYSHHDDQDIGVAVIDRFTLHSFALIQNSIRIESCCERSQTGFKCITSFFVNAMARTKRAAPPSKDERPSKRLKSANGLSANTTATVALQHSQFRNSFEEHVAKLEDWEAIHELMKSLIEKVKHDKPIALVEDHLICDLTEFQGDNTGRWLKRFRTTHPTSDSKEARIKQQCYLKLTDLVNLMGLQHQIHINSWEEIINGALYEEAFNDILNMRGKPAKIASFEIEDSFRVKQNDVPKDKREGVFSPLYDFYFLASSFSWTVEGRVWLPSAKQKWHANATQREQILKVVLRKLQTQLEAASTKSKSKPFAGKSLILRALRKWLHDNLGMSDAPLLNQYWQLLLLEPYSTSTKCRFKIPIKQVAELLNDSDWDEDESDKLKWIAAMIIQSKGKRPYKQLIDFAVINKNMATLYDLCILAGLNRRTRGLNPRETQLKYSLVRHELRLILEGQLDKQSDWWDSTARVLWEGKIKDDELALLGAECITAIIPTPHNDAINEHDDDDDDHDNDAINDHDNDNDGHNENHRPVELFKDIISVIREFVGGGGSDRTASIEELKKEEIQWDPTRCPPAPPPMPAYMYQHMHDIHRHHRFY